MRNCEVYEEWISAFLDGELSGEERAELQEHMAACPGCQRYFDDLVAMHEALMDGEDVPVPEGFADQVMERVRTTEQDAAGMAKVIRFPQWRRWAAMAACCAVVLLGVWRLQVRSAADQAQSQAWVTADKAPREVDVPASDSAEDGIMLMMDEGQPVVDDLDRVAGDASRSRNGEEADDAAERESSDSAECALETAKAAPEPSPAPPAGDTAGAVTSRGTLTAGGDAVRQWVEDELGLDWERGQVYELTAEQYDGLVEVLTEAGVEFRVEPGDGWRLTAD